VNVLNIVVKVSDMRLGGCCMAFPEAAAQAKRSEIPLPAALRTAVAMLDSLCANVSMDKSEVFISSVLRKRPAVWLDMTERQLAGMRRSHRHLSRSVEPTRSQHEVCLPFHGEG